MIKLSTKFSALVKSKPLFISLVVAFTVLAGSITFFLIEPAPQGFLKTLLPPMGDEELYLTIFNGTSLARIIVNPTLSSLFGYHSADALKVMWTVTLSGILAFGIFLLIHSILNSDSNPFFDEKKIMFISGFSALFFIAFFDELKIAIGTLVAISRTGNLQIILNGNFYINLENALQSINGLFQSFFVDRTGGVLGGRSGPPCLYDVFDSQR